MQVAYAAEMEEARESPRKRRRRESLIALIAEVGDAATLARESGTPKSHISVILSGKRGIGDELAAKWEQLYDKEPGWFDREHITGVSDTVVLGEPPHGGPSSSTPELVIRQYDTGGSMGRGLILRDQPGVINSWHVSQEWIQKNVHNVTSPKHLAIVTGFGDSMKPMYNPGDPLLVDTGVKSVEFDGVYFFRIGDEGFIKRLQRIPGQGLIAISENKAYRDFTIDKTTMEFEVFARVVKVWRGDDY
jgi:hypothetical protein